MDFGGKVKYEARLPDRPFLASPLAGASGLVLILVPVETPIDHGHITIGQWPSHMVLASRASGCLFGHPIP